MNSISNLFSICVFIEPHPHRSCSCSQAPGEENRSSSTIQLLKVGQLKLLVDGFSDESSSHGSSLVSGGVEVIPPTPSPSPETRTELMISIKPCCDLAHRDCDCGFESDHCLSKLQKGRPPSPVERRPNSLVDAWFNPSRQKDEGSKLLARGALGPWL